MSLTERFETLRLEEERVSATPAKPVSQMLLSPLVPATSPQPSDAPASEVWITPHQLPFAPKCHPELQYPIESSWAKMKGHIRRRCKHTLPSLRENIIAALQPDNIPLTLVQKWFRKMRDYMAAYEDGATGKTADKKVKQYRSHRQCFDKTPAGGSNLPEPIRLVERDSIIDLTELPSVEMVSSAAEDLGEIGM